MICKAYVVARNYSKPGPCLSRNNVRLVRWARTPLITLVIKGLCTAHRKRLEAGRPVPFVGEQTS